MKSLFAALVLLFGSTAALQAQSWGGYPVQTWSRPAYGYYVQAPAAIDYGRQNYYGNLQNGYSYNPRIAYYGDQSYWSDRQGYPYYSNGFADTYYGGYYDRGASTGVVIGPMRSDADASIRRAVGPVRPQ